MVLNMKELINHRPPLVICMVRKPALYIFFLLFFLTSLYAALDAMQCLHMEHFDDGHHSTMVEFLSSGKECLYLINVLLKGTASTVDWTSPTSQTYRCQRNKLRTMHIHYDKDI